MGLLPGIGKKWPIADQRVSRTLVSVLLQNAFRGIEWFFEKFWPDLEVLEALLMGLGVSNSFCWRVLESRISICHFFFLFCLLEKFFFKSWSQILVPKLWFPSCFSNGKLPYPKTSRTTINYQLITTDNTQNSCDRRVLHVHQDLVIIICKGVFFNLSIFPVHTNTLSTCLPTWFLITLSRFSWDSLFLICSGEAVCFCVAVKTRFDN